MAQLRLIALALCAACGRGDAAPLGGSGLTAPAGWKPAPEIAKAAHDAAGAGATASEAWAEPARGCYAVWIGLHGAAGAIDAAADQLVASVQKLGVATTEVTRPAAGERGELQLAFAKPPYRGKLRAQLAKTGDVVVLACVWNEREPKACEAGCAALLGEPAMTSLVLAIVLAFAQPGSSYQLPTMDEVPHERVPPLNVPPPAPGPDRRPVFLGAGIVGLAGLFWWSARRRARIEHEEDPDDR